MGWRNWREDSNFSTTFYSYSKNFKDNITKRLKYAFARENVVTWKFKLAILCVTHILLHVYTNTPFTLIPILMDEYSLTMFQLSLLVSVPRGIQLLLSIPSGLLADKFSAEKLISLSLFLSVIAGLLLFTSSSIWSLIIGFALIAASSTIYHPPALSATSEVIPEDYRSRGMGFHGASGSFGISLGPITIGLVLNSLGWRYTYVIWTLPILIVAIITLFLKIDCEKRERRIKEEEKKFTAPLRHIFSLTFIAFLLFISMRSAAGSSISTFITTYLTKGRGIDPSIASIIFGLSPLIGLGGPIIGGWLGDKLGWKRTFIIIFSIMITSLTLLVISPIVLLSVIFYLLYGISSTMTMPISSTLVALVTPEEARGTAYSMFFIPMSVAGIIMPIIASLLVDLYGIWIIFPIAIILYLSALTLIKVIKV